MVPWPFPRASSRGSIDSSGRHPSSALSADGDQEDPVASAQEEYELNVALAISQSANEAHQVAPLPFPTPPAAQPAYHPQPNAFMYDGEPALPTRMTRRVDNWTMRLRSPPQSACPWHQAACHQSMAWRRRCHSNTGTATGAHQSLPAAHISATEQPVGAWS